MHRKAKSNGPQRRRPTVQRVPVTVRLPEDIVDRIDRELGGRDVPLSRNNWFLEAALEKLRRTQSGEPHGAK
jgi:hypothetical protein